MTAEFDWWLLIVGLVIGAGLVWLILAELPRRDAEIEESEVAVEAGWIAAQLEADGRRLDPGVVEAILRHHRAYLRLPPPDEPSGEALPPTGPPATPAAPALPDAAGTTTSPPITHGGGTAGSS